MGVSSPSVTTARKWLGLVAAVWIQSISGNKYTFSNYSDALKSLMFLTQPELNNLSVAKDVGKAFGLLAGLACNRFPTWLMLLIGSVEGVIGYGVEWLVVSQRIQPLPYWQLDTILVSPLLPYLLGWVVEYTQMLEVVLFEKCNLVYLKMNLGILLLLLIW